MDLQPLHRSAETDVSCPHCGHAFRGKVALVADAGGDPALAGAARRGEVNRLGCPVCHRRFMAASPVLFVDPARRLAAAYIPAAVGPEAAGLADVLVGLYLRTARQVEVQDYLLAPLLCRDPAEFAACLADEPAVPPQPLLHPLLDQAQRWAAEADEPEVAEGLAHLAQVHSHAELVELLNDRAALLEPGFLLALALAADAAERDGRDDVAEALRDASGLLRIHTPPAELDPAEAQLAVHEALATDDPAIVSHALEPPRQPGDAVRELLGYDAPAQREGFAEHAALFSGLVDDMMEPQAPYDADEPEPEPPAALPGDALDELMACPGLDQALEVLGRHPALVSAAAVDILEGLAATALDQDDEVRANHLHLLLDAIVVAGLGDDEDEDEGEEETDA